MKITSYKGTLRETGNRGKVITGLVSCPSKGCWHGIYEVREKGETLLRVSGLSQRTLRFAREIAHRNNLSTS